MAIFKQAEAQATLDARFPTTGGTDYIGWSVDGTTEFSGLARTAVGATGWAAATAALPSVKANGSALTSAAATAATTGAGIGYFAVFSASTGGTQRTIWQAVGTAKPLGIGDNVAAAIGALSISLS